MPLAVAASKADFKIMKSLLENGADVYLVHFIPVPLYTELTFIFLPFHLHGLSVSIKSQSLQFFAFCTTQ